MDDIPLSPFRCGPPREAAIMVVPLGPFDSVDGEPPPFGVDLLPAAAIVHVHFLDERLPVPIR